ncbi:MAG: DUF4093 domain-containing protein [Oscillospiraceae bacterium]|nr:DUF4093 domain-containing protein [Oscillospiraceae bacterium]
MIHIDQAIIVEGKYDRMRLSEVTDAPIVEAGGFNLFHDEEKQSLIKKFSETTGIIILTDSDPAGGKLRSFIAKIARGGKVVHAYVPEVKGKEQRKTQPGAAGILGVEGIDNRTIEDILMAVAENQGSDDGEEVSFSEWYEAGFSGREGSRQRREEFLLAHGLPRTLSQRQALKYLNSIYSSDDLRKEMGLKL